jgi:hypothetical protein
MVQDVRNEPKVPIPGHRAEPGTGAAGRMAELDGPAGPDPVRYGDWERRGRCIDF